MYIAVIPSSHSISTTPLTYSVGDVFRPQIHIGSLVEIPLGKGIETGFVAGIGNALGNEEESPMTLGGVTTGDFRGEIKSITQVICSTPILAEYQIRLIESLARRYMLPIHRVLGFFLTRPILRRLEKSNFGELDEVSREKKVLHRQNSHIFFLQHTIITPEILKEYIHPKTIVVCPDDFSILQYEKIFQDDGHFFLQNDTTDARRSKAWRDIRNGLHNVVFSTRKILFFNLERYDHILYLEDAFFDEYFHYPTHIHYTEVLKYIDETGQFDIDILTSIPLLKTLSTFRHFTLENIA